MVWSHTRPTPSRGPPRGRQDGLHPLPAPAQPAQPQPGQLQLSQASSLMAGGRGDLLWGLGMVTLPPSPGEPPDPAWRACTRHGLAWAWPRRPAWLGPGPQPGQAWPQTPEPGQAWPQPGQPSLSKLENQTFSLRIAHTPPVLVLAPGPPPPPFQDRRFHLSCLPDPLPPLARTAICTKSVRRQPPFVARHPIRLVQAPKPADLFVVRQPIRPIQAPKTG